MASSPSKESFAVPEMEDISPSGVWSSDDEGNSSTSDDVQDHDNTLSADEAAAKDEKFTWPFKKFSELAKSAKGRVTSGMLQFIEKQ